MAEFLLVDGYNIINAWAELAVLTDNLEYARDKLVDILAEYGAYKDYRVVIVFDAHAVSGGDNCIDTVPGKLQVVFTKEGETADSYIEKVTYRLVREGNKVYVGTSDRAEQLTVLGMGAWRVSARELREDVREMEKCIKKGYEETAASRRRHEIQGRLEREVVRRMEELRRST